MILLSRTIIAEMESLEFLLARTLTSLWVVRSDSADVCVYCAHVCGSKNELLANLPVKTLLNDKVALAPIN